MGNWGILGRGDWRTGGWGGGRRGRQPSRVDLAWWCDGTARLVSMLGLDPAYAGEGALDAAGPILHDVGVDHGGPNVFVAKELLHRAEVVAGFEQVGCETVPQAMCVDGFDDTGFVCCAFERFLQDAFVDVVTLAHAAAGVD